MIKDVHWHGTSLKDIQGFPSEARKEVGYELHLVQSGENPDDWKPIPSVGKGVREIRIHCKNEYRVIYLAKLKDAIHILHAFVKKTQKTPKKDIEIAKQRYQRL